jgi:hypothetical protein
MEGHSYCNIMHIGYRFFWTKTQDKARVFECKDLADRMASISKGKVITAPNPEVK